MANVIPLMPAIQELPEAVQSLRTERERAFVWTYMFNGGDGAKAARAAGYSDVKEGAKVRAHGLLQRQDVQDALAALCTRYLFSLAPVALVKLSKHLHSKNEKVSLKAVDMTLKRTGYGEKQTIDVNVGGEVRVVDHTAAAVADLRRLIALGVPEEKLIEAFGFTGLSRYRKLLALEDRRAAAEAAPVVDAEFEEVSQNG